MSTSFVVYHGHHYENTNLYGKNFLLLPSSSFVEREGLFVNCQGRCQIAGQAVAPAGDSISNERTIYSLYKCFMNEEEGDSEFEGFSALFSRVLPYRINYISSFNVCSYIQQHSTITCFYIRSTIIFINIRTFYDIDIISRSNTDFFDINSDYNSVHNYS